MSYKVMERLEAKPCEVCLARQSRQAKVTFWVIVISAIVYVVASLVRF